MKPKKSEYLICTDFDKTLADTMKPSPNNMGVLQAYEFAIRSVLGNEGLKTYSLIGGLQNRAPIELVNALLKNSNNKEKLIRNAAIFFRKQLPSLKKFTPEGKTTPIIWDSANIETTISEMIVLSKLSCFMDEIGTKLKNGGIWPEPCAGVLDFIKAIDYINRKGKVKIRLAILSSGHTPFIQKTFKVWKQECPSILIADDDVRMLPIEQERKVKPSKFLFDLVFLDWLQTLEWKGEASKHRENVMYIGDDMDKDGKLADNAGVLFGWFNPDNKKNGNLNGGFSFRDWYRIANFLRQEDVLKSLEKGEPLAKIFLPLF